MIESRFARFVFVGAVGAVVQFAGLALLIGWLGWSSLIATPLAVEAAVLHNFIWHERFTWRDCRTQGSAGFSMRLLRFHLANGAVSLAGNVVLMYLLVDLACVPFGLAAVAAIGLCSFANFCVMDRWIYARTR